MLENVGAAIRGCMSPEKKAHRTVIISYFPDATGPNIRKGQRLLSKCLFQKKNPPQLFGRKSVGQKRAIKNLMLLIKYL